MEFWTILFLTILDPRLDGYPTHILYPSEAECNAARSIVSETMHYDHKTECFVSTVASKSIRPKRRPTP